jgi:hypothetical protein
VASDRSSPAPCPLCGEPARLSDHDPSSAWIAVDGCACGGFVVWAELLAVRRLQQAPPDERTALRARIVELRAKRARAAWLTTDDGRADGRLAVRTRRPAPRAATNPRLEGGRYLRPFVFAGHVTRWDPINRALEIGPRAFRVVLGAEVAGLAAGLHVTVGGYVEQPPDSVPRAIVTRVVLG